MSEIDVDPVEYEAWINECHAQAYDQETEEQQFYGSVQHLLRVVNRVISQRPDCFKIKHDDFVALIEAAADVEPWFEDNDPRSMGWVNDKGQP